MDNMDIASAIKRRRLAAGYTQTDLARAMGVDRSAAVRLEQPGNLPTIRTLLRVAHALGVSASQLLRDAERAAK